jgi:prepilin-type N-terminal cleavage/methylation domain-containing protein
MRKTTSGFTIVELLVVIVVIAILAAITVVAYNGIQTRANDSKIRATAAQVQKAIQLWGVQTGVLPQAGYGSTGAAANDACPGNTTASGGWFQKSSYPCTMQDLLIARGLLTNDITSTLPANSVTGYSLNDFMFYPCNNVAGSYVLFWNLKSPSAEEVANLNSISSKCYGVANASSLSQYSTYGMRSAVIIALN